MSAPISSADRLSILALSAFTVLIAVITYGFGLFTLDLSIDEEDVAARMGDALWQLAVGRWGQSVLDVVLLPQPVIPVLPMAILILALSAGYVVSSLTWRSPIGLAHYAGAPFAIAFPTLIHLFIFVHVGYAAAIGVALAAVAVRMIARDKPHSAAAAVAPMTVALGIYLPLIVFPVVSFLTFACLRLPEAGLGKTFRRIARFALVLAAAFVLDLIIARSVVAVFAGADLAQKAADYAQAYLHPGDLLAAPGRVLTSTAVFTWSVLTGTSDMFVEGGWAFMLAIVLAGALSFRGIWRRCAGFGQRLLGLVLILLVALAPILVVAAGGGYLPYRTLVGVPLGFAALVFIAMSVPGDRLVRGLLAALCVLSFVEFAAAANRLYYAQHLAAQADRELAGQIISRMGSLVDLDQPGAVSVEFAGSRPLPDSIWFPKVRDSTLGASYFEWDGGRPRRIIAYLHAFGCEADLEPISDEQRRPMLTRISAMPSWPAEGSIRLIDGTVVVKLSGYTPQQKLRYGLAD